MNYKQKLTVDSMINSCTFRGRQFKSPPPPLKKEMRYGKEFNDTNLNASLVIAHVYRRVLKPHSGTMVLGRHTEFLFVGLFNTPASPIESVKDKGEFW